MIAVFYRLGGSEMRRTSPSDPGGFTISKAMWVSRAWALDDTCLVNCATWAATVARSAIG